MELALFDLDNTLLSGDSDFEWAQFLISQGVLDEEIYAARNLEFYEQYRAGTLDIYAFLEFQLRPLARHARSELDNWHKQFMRQRILPMIGAKARSLVEHHRSQGHTLVIITATNRFVTEPIAEAFGISNLIATEAEAIAGEFTGQSVDTPCFREGKVQRLEAWLGQQRLTWQDVRRSWFYSDSHNDLFLLERVSDPVAVDPDAALTEIAKERGWPILSLR